MKKLILFAALAGVFLFTGKVYGVPAQNAVNNANSESAYTASNNGSSSKNDRGAEIYYRKCMACHQVTGMGIPGTFPPLKGSDFLKSATKARLIEQVMNGSNEHLVVNGVTYTSPMPPQVDNAEDAVAVVNYVLNSWGNHYGKATLQNAKKIKPVSGNRNHMMMNGMGMMGRWGMGFWWIGGLVIMGLFAWFVVTMVGRSSNNHYSHGESALDILKKRYARGEISKEEFDQMSRDLRY